MYVFEKQQSRFSQGAVKARELDFKSYVEWRFSNSPLSICNYQVHFCSRSKDSRHDKPSLADLQRAIANLSKIDLVGTVERYSEWLKLAQWLLSRQFRRLSLAVLLENIRVPRNDNTPAGILHDLEEELGPSLSEQLLQCNYLDLCLYRIADARLTQSFSHARLTVSLEVAGMTSVRKAKLSAPATNSVRKIWGVVSRNVTEAGVA